MIRSLPVFSFLVPAFVSCAAPLLAADPLGGLVLDPNGEPAAEIRVKLFDANTESFVAEDALASDATGPDGRFRLLPDGDGPWILKLAGEAGRGRIRLDGSAPGETLELTYPVRSTLIVLHDNDTHWNLNHGKAFRAKVEAYRDRHPDVFLLSGGDLFIRHRHRWPEDSLEYYEERSAFMVDQMNRLRYDAAVLGNHELHYHGEATRRVLEQAEFPLLSANVAIETDKLPETILPAVTLKTATRYRIGVVGLSAVPEMVGLRALDLFETARAYVDELRNTSELLLALTHIGHRRDRQLAESIPDFDLIVGGHSHTLLRDGDEVNGVLIVQAGGVPPGHPVSDRLPRYLGRVKLTLENGRIVEKEAIVYVFPGPDTGGDAR